MTGPSHKVVLLDNSSIYRGLLKQLRTRGMRLSLSGAGFAQGQKFEFNQNIWHILQIPFKDSHRLTWLSIGALSMNYSINEIIGISRAKSLINSLHPGDLALFQTASAVPYPAVFANQDPYSTSPPHSQQYYSTNPEIFKAFHRVITDNRFRVTWQLSLPTVHCGYCKHPTEGGSLLPWAPEQFALLQQQGIEVISEMPVGLLEAQQDYPGCKIISIGQVQSSPSPEGDIEWKRYRRRFNNNAIRLIMLLTGLNLTTINP